jgi:dTDP-4-amino-4,6-dideoxygalactose transaminase
MNSNTSQENLIKHKAIRSARAIFGDEELEGIRDALDYGYCGLAYKGDEFEEGLKKYLGAKYVVATNTGTTALHLSMDALGIKSGDEVIVPSLTFVGSFQAISATGATPVACDIEPETLNLDLEDVKRKITEQTKAIMPVHYSGNPCDMDALLEIKENSGIRIIEDAAHAFGSKYNGKKIGSFGDITCFSFGSLKNLTCGEGGAIVTDDQEISDLLVRKRVLGMDRRRHSAKSFKERGGSFYKVAMQGFRYHLGNINAAIGLAQLKKVDSFIERRREICRKYDASLIDIPSVTPLPNDYSSVAPHIYVVRILNDQRDALMNLFHSRNIETGVAFPPNHLHEFYKRSNYSLPETEKAVKEIMSLPLHCGLCDSDVQLVIQAIRDFFNKE